MTEAAGHFGQHLTFGDSDAVESLMAGDDPAGSESLRLERRKGAGQLR